MLRFLVLPLAVTATWPPHPPPPPHGPPQTPPGLANPLPGQGNPPRGQPGNPGRTDRWGGTPSSYGQPANNDLPLGSSGSSSSSSLMSPTPTATGVAVPTVPIGSLPLGSSSSSPLSSFIAGPTPVASADASVSIGGASVLPTASAGASFSVSAGPTALPSVSTDPTPLPSASPSASGTLPSPSPSALPSLVPFANYTPREGYAVYEPEDGQVYMGAWYDRIKGDTPNDVNARIAYKPFSLFQVDADIGTIFKVDDLRQFADQMDATGTDAVMYFTLYPKEGYDAITESAMQALVAELTRIRSTGRRIMLRYASEMNGSWFSYGQTPSKFIREWRRFVDYIRARVNGIAFVWGPNSGNGYPFPNLEFSVKPGTPEYDEMDTNKDGVVDILDDPYTPFWPGAEYVDWVGMSVYHYGFQWPWVTNDVPVPGKAETILLGRFDASPISYNIYEMFSGPNSPYKKPFSIAETGATFHVRRLDGTPLAPGASNFDIKQVWWRQLLNETFFAAYPKVKAICFFEFTKSEEETFRDFKAMTIEEGLAAAFREDLKSLPSIMYANVTSAAAQLIGSARGAESAASSVVVPVLLTTLVGLFGLLLV